jgi:hypothetical protein
MWKKCQKETPDYKTRKNARLGGTHVINSGGEKKHTGEKNRKDIILFYIIILAGRGVLGPSLRPSRREGDWIGEARMENGGVWSDYHSRPFVNFRSTSLCQPQGEGHTPKGEKIVDIILYYYHYYYK